MVARELAFEPGTGLPPGQTVAGPKPQSTVPPAD